MIYLVNPNELVKEGCILYIKPPPCIDKFCGDRIQPMYGVPPI